MLKPNNEMRPHWFASAVCAALQKPEKFSPVAINHGGELVTALNDLSFYHGLTKHTTLILSVCVYQT